jgi:hypothetical protein
MPKGRQIPYRQRKNGKEYGPFLFNWRGYQVNLRTKDANKANDRAKEVRAGRREFEADDGAAAASVAATVVGTEGAKTPSVVEPPAPAASGLPSAPPPGASPLPPTHTGPAALPPIGGPPADQTPPQREEVRPDEVIPPVPGWAEKVSEAAGAQSAPPEGEGEGPSVDPEFIDGLCEQAADLAVELQLMGQAWLIKKRLEANAGAVPLEGPGSKGRIVGRQIWVRELKKLMPDDLDFLPGWLVAPLMVGAYTLPVQLKGATPIVKTPPSSPDPETPPAPAAEGAPPEGAI